MLNRTSNGVYMNSKLILFSILILVLSNLSFRWPVDNGVITSTFGESRGDHFHDGIDMTSPVDNVYPVERGTLLYAWNKSFFPLENYWGGGNYKIIAHDNGIMSVYMHLQDIDNLKQTYSISDVVGLIGNTGHSYGKHIHFSILDHQKKESINPMKFLPVHNDSKAPEVYNFYIKIDDRYIRINDNSDIRLTKHYPMLVEIKDTIKGHENLGIYRIKAMFNGKEAANQEFSAIDYSSNGLIVNNRIFSDLFDEKGYYKLTGLVFNEGTNTLNVSVSDFNGNTSEKIFTINVNLDIQ
jgi:hypothetical protein